MADSSASTPFLADNDHDHGDSYEGEESLSKNAPANAYFKRPIRILSAITSLFSLLIFGLLIAALVLLKVGPFNYTYSSNDTVRDLAICLFVNTLLTTPTVFIQVPILINIVVNIVMSIVILAFSSVIFGNSWPDSSFCRRYEQGPPPGYGYTPLPELPECQDARTNVRIVMGVAAGCAIMIGILILATLLLRVIALVKTRFWEGKAKAFGKFGGWKPSGFTVQFTLSILPHDANDKKATVDASGGSGEEGRLIET